MLQYGQRNPQYRGSWTIRRENTITRKRPCPFSIRFRSIITFDTHAFTYLIAFLWNEELMHGIPRLIPFCRRRDYHTDHTLYYYRIFVLACSTCIAKVFKRVSRNKREESRLTLDWLASHPIVFSMVSSLPTMHFFCVETRFRTGIDSQCA